MEYLLLFVVLALIFATYTSIKKTRKANVVIEDMRKFRHQTKILTEQLEDIKSFVINHCDDKDFVNNLKEYLGVDND